MSCSAGSFFEPNFRSPIYCLFDLMSLNTVLQREFVQDFSQPNDAFDSHAEWGNNSFSMVWNLVRGTEFDRSRTFV